MQVFPPGLVAAPHTPMYPDGSLNLDMVAEQARHLSASGVRGVFVGGSTGESLSLTTSERLELAERWCALGRSAGLVVAIHTGHNALAQARALARAAGELGADVVAAMPPSYFKPDGVEELVSWCAAIAAEAPGTPFFYYHIPRLTHVEHSMARFLELGRDAIPTLAGMKFTDRDLVELQRCLRLEKGRFQILFGWDESLMAGLALGARTAVGSTYNFAAGLYLRIMAAFERGDLEAARAEQARSIQMIETISRHGYAAANKEVMALIGLDCGCARPPLHALSAEHREALRRDLEQIGFFDWRL